jgi:hypothetical protein
VFRPGAADPCGGRGLSVSDAAEVARRLGEAGTPEIDDSAGKPLPKLLVGGGVNLVFCAKNSLSRPVVSASDSHVAISALEWWVA